MEHKRNLKRKRKDESNKKRSGITHNIPSTSAMPPSDHLESLSYRPLSRTTFSRHTGTCTHTQVIQGAPARQSTLNGFQSHTVPLDVSSSMTQSLPTIPSQLSYDREMWRHSSRPSGRKSEEHSVGDYPSLPPGAYVNPSFFIRPTDPAPPPSLRLPPDIQQQLDILNRLQ